MVVAFYFRLHLAYFPRPVVAIFARPEHCDLSIAPEAAKGQKTVVESVEIFFNLKLNLPVPRRK